MALAAKGVPACASAIAALISAAGTLGSIAVIFKSPLVKTGTAETVPPVGVDGNSVALVSKRPVASTTFNSPEVVLAGEPVPTKDTEISVLPLSSRRNLFSISAAKAAPVAALGARLLTVMVFPPKFITKEEKSPAAAGVLNPTEGKVADVGTCATYFAPKSGLAFKALAKAAVVSSLVASTETATVFLAPSGPNVRVTESVGIPLVLKL